MTQVDDDGQVPFNGFDGQPFEWPDTSPPLPEIDWTDSTPLNSVGMPYYTTPLLSSWSSSFASGTPYFPPPQKIPLQILNSMKTNDNVAYATLPKELRGKRNVVATTQRKPNARFRSGKAKPSEVRALVIALRAIVDMWARNLRRPSWTMVKMHRRCIVKLRSSTPSLEWKILTLGVYLCARHHDLFLIFAYSFYNKTDYSGLETHILNSYTNSMLQAMHYSLPIRRLAKSHIATDCNREHCLLCELGFVVRMLEDARGTNCQSSNFCKTVGVLAQCESLYLIVVLPKLNSLIASNSIDLIDYGRESTEVDHSHMIQSFHRFLVDHLSIEGNAFPHNPVLMKPPGHVSDPYNPAAAPVTQLMGIDAKNIITCVSCKAVRMKENVTHIIDLIYPRKVFLNLTLRCA